MLAVDVATFHYLDIGVCTKFFMKFENVRIFMKMVSLITNLKKALISEKERQVRKRRRDSRSVNDEVYFPTPEQYSYFLIAPTLIFRNYYPRNEKIRIINIAHYFVLWLVSLYNCFFHIQVPLFGALRKRIIGCARAEFLPRSDFLGIYNRPPG